MIGTAVVDDDARMARLDVDSLRLALRDRSADLAMKIATTERDLGLALLLGQDAGAARESLVALRARAEDVRVMLLAMTELQKRQEHALSRVQALRAVERGDDTPARIAAYDRALADFTRSIDNSLFADGPQRIEAAARLWMATCKTTSQERRNHVQAVLRDRHVDFETVRRRVSVIESEQELAARVKV